ncbi:lytic transglycosylase domain-containing protein [Thermotoga caldifontis]|uniref:lytic transglycosylase domain-containing protein n=1 Tax=Thermotoga caldifontis TaxID=1508419 RepID=UPI000870AAA3|nr:lytic transglycosylase domain-containing protein [Thermotoga caldifontis]
MKKLLWLFSLLCLNLVLANPLVLLNEPAKGVSVTYQPEQFRLTVLLPVVHPVAPIDWFLPKDSAKILKGLIGVESNFFVHAVSEKGAMGLTQLMPATAKELGVPNAFNVFSSIDAANRYLNQLFARFSSVQLALAAYHEGPGRVERQGPSTEGIGYAQKVLTRSRQLEGKTIFLRDVTYFEPYVELGKDVSGGLNVYLSLLGAGYVVGGFEVSNSISHQVLFYPAITHDFSLIIGEKDLKLVGGFLYRKVPNFGFQVLFGEKDFDASGIVRVWKFYVTAGFSSGKLRVGMIFK